MRIVSARFLRLSLERRIQLLIHETARGFLNTSRRQCLMLLAARNPPEISACARAEFEAC